jgi:hypothetical protein
MKARNSKYTVDKELEGIKNLKTMKQVANDKDAYDGILKDAVITRTAVAGTDYITQTRTYAVTEIELDPNSIIYEYEYNGEIHRSNFLFNNPINTIMP